MWLPTSCSTNRMSLDSIFDFGDVVVRLAIGRSLARLSAVYMPTRQRYPRHDHSRCSQRGLGIPPVLVFRACHAIG